MVGKFKILTRGLKKILSVILWNKGTFLGENGKFHWLKEECFIAQGGMDALGRTHRRQTADSGTDDDDHDDTCPGLGSQIVKLNVTPGTSSG